MKCPFCHHIDTHVKDSRPSEDDTVIRRRRHCSECDSRFTTFERIQLREIFVIKRNGERRSFDRDKITRSVAIALRKRPVMEDAQDKLVADIVKALESRGETDITSEVIGQHVMDGLKQLDHIGYIRYASVYRDFREVDDFQKFMKTMETA